jgi:hypothetical protein
MKNKILKSGFSVLAFLIFTLPILAQDDPNDPYAGDDPHETPIDNWMLLLVFVALVIGIYFIVKARRNSLGTIK